MLAVSVCCTANMFLHIFFTPFELILLMVAAELIRMAETRLETPSKTYWIFLDCREESMASSTPKRSCSDISRDGGLTKCRV